MDYLDIVARKVHRQQVKTKKTHPDSLGILEKPNKSMWSGYRALRPKAQVLCITTQAPTHLKETKASTFNRDPYHRSMKGFKNAL